MVVLILNLMFHPNHSLLLLSLHFHHKMKQGTNYSDEWKLEKLNERWYSYCFGKELE